MAEIPKNVVRLKTRRARRVELERHKHLLLTFENLQKIAPELDDFPAFEELKTQIEMIIDFLEEEL